MIARSASLLLASFLLGLAAGCDRSGTPEGDRAATPAATSSAPSILKISALANGEILLDGKPCSADELAARLSEARKNNGQVYYFREAADQEPHPNAMQAVQMIDDSHLPVSLSTLADFSDFVDENGESHPRQ